MEKYQGERPKCPFCGKDMEIFERDCDWIDVVYWDCPDCCDLEKYEPENKL